MKKAQKRMIMLVVGVLAAVAIIFSQLFYYQSLEHNKKEVKTEQQQNQSTDDDQAFFSVPSTSMPTSTEVELHHKSFLLLEILLEDDDVEVDPDQTPFHLNTFLHTLFSAIISPNAP
jgi:hypothetical protein